MVADLLRCSKSEEAISLMIPLHVLQFIKQEAYFMSLYSGNCVYLGHIVETLREEGLVNI